MCFSSGVREYHKTVLKGVEVNGHSLLPPPRVRLNKNNINVAQKALLSSYRTSDKENNPYAALKSHNGKFYSIMHDGIQKFAKELNGTYVRTISSTNQIATMPWGLTDIEGGSLNAEKLVTHLIKTIAQIKPLKNNAFEIAPKKVASLAGIVDDLNIPSPPLYFKLGKIEDEIDVNKKIIKLVVEDWPLNLMADGCSTNTCASNKISDELGLLSPSLRCVSHAADGTIKRMVNSKTMNVPEISEFLPSFRTILRHFQLSGKSTALLNEALDVLEMKSIHMMTFCPTRMSYLLSAAKQSVNLLAPICDVLATADIKADARDCFMSPKSMIVMHLLADLENVFLKNYLRVLDGDHGLITECYQVRFKYQYFLCQCKFRV